MTSAPASPAKICVGCKADVTNAPRMKDTQGRYYCQSCASKAPKAAAPAKPATNVVAAVAASGDDFMSKIINEAASKGSTTCPSCQHPISADARICTGCGFNLESGKKAHTRVERVKHKEKSVKSTSSLSDSTIYQFFAWSDWGIATIMGAPLLLCTALAFVQAPIGLGLYYLFMLISGLALSIWLLIDAFRQSVVRGLLCLLVPFYSIIYVLFMTESSRLKCALYINFIAGAVLVVLAMMFQNELAAAMK